MSSQWEEVQLGDVADIVVGFAFSSRSFTDDDADIKLLRGINVSQGHLDWSNCARWPLGNVSDFARYELEIGDVVLAMDRPWVEAGLKRAKVKPRDLPSLLVQRVARLRGTHRAVTGFIHCLLASPQFTDYIRPIVTGVNIPHISQTQIAAFKFRLPDVASQEYIVDVLDSFEDLIDANESLGERLEESARALYHEWFILQRFPNHRDAEFVDTRLGQVPSNWRIGCVADIAALQRKNVRPDRFPDEVFGHCSIPAFDKERLPSMEPGSSISAVKYEVDRPAVLVSKLNPRIQRVWFIEPTTDYRTICSTEFLPFVADDSTALAYLHGVMTSESMSSALIGLSGGTSTSHQRARPEDVQALPVVVPTKEIACAYAEKTLPILQLSAALREKNSSLRNARDLLLPRLLRGDVDVDALGLADTFGWSNPVPTAS